MEVPARRPVETPPEPPADPRIEALNTRWEQFEKADYEGQIALFVQTLGEPELMDSEMAFEMLARIYDGTVEHDERDRLDHLVGALRERLPDVYRQSAHFCLDWLITNAVATGRFDTIRPMAEELAPAAGEYLETVYGVMDLLAYHGQLPTLVAMARIAWPKVEESPGLIPGAADEFAERATTYELFDYIENAASPEPTDPELLERLAPLPEPDRQAIARFLNDVTGKEPRDWSMSDLEVRASGLTDKGRRHLGRLCLQFIDYLHRQEGVRFTKAAMVAHDIQLYIQERLAGELEQESPVGAPRRRRRRKPKRRHGVDTLLLCPDRKSLDCFLATHLLQFFSLLHHRAAALLELVPAWLRFTEAKGLIDSEQRQRTVNELRGLNTDLAKLCETQCADPALPRALAEWPEEGSQEPCA